MLLHYNLFLILRIILILIIVVKLRLNQIQQYLFSPLIVAIASTFVFDAIAMFHEQGSYITRNILFNKKHPFLYGHSLPIELQLLMLFQTTFTWLAIIFNLLLLKNINFNNNSIKGQQQAMQQEGKAWIRVHLSYFKPTLIGIAISALGTCLLHHSRRRHPVDFSTMESFQQFIMLIYAITFMCALLWWQWSSRRQQQQQQQQQQPLSPALLIYGIITLLQPLQSTTDSITIIVSYLGRTIQPYELMVQTTLLPVLSFTLYFFEIQTPLIILLLTLRSGPHWASRQVQPTAVIDVEKAVPEKSAIKH
ncbi:hypothetical protein BDA99DRAFT_524398 [Phascolomyces articulosus]|uniref:Uncharacterized protein n=1 Tax=Phascolomyces articulosus TaxID=60185 RepID=A0AAD5P9F9_9FUNG|nr:hypothetical protein BDA99DRAFT_524398 [Phascolomyces articulosus]